MSMPPIKVSSTVTGNAAVVEVAGDLDVDTASELRLALYRCVRERPGSLTVDLSGVEFSDCAGLNVLLWARRWAIETGAGFRLLNARPQFVKLLAMTGTAELFREAAPRPGQVPLPPSQAEKAVHARRPRRSGRKTAPEVGSLP
jgi:anti-anti-sigma factor